jgi:hypothetical protein
MSDTLPPTTPRALLLQFLLISWKKLILLNLLNHCAPQNSVLCFVCCLVIHNDLVLQLYSLDDCSWCSCLGDNDRSWYPSQQPLIESRCASLCLEKPCTSMLGIDGSNHHTLLSFGPDCPHEEWAVFLHPMFRRADDEAKRPTRW